MIQGFAFHIWTTPAAEIQVRRVAGCLFGYMRFGHRWSYARERSPMKTRPYTKPPFMQRHVGNRMSVLFRPSLADHPMFRITASRPVATSGRSGTQES
jgi:hypothetical protein